MWELALLVVGVGLLVKGADWLVEGSSALAKRLGVSSLVIGLTVVAFGTSTPELVVNVVSALAGKGDVAFGNVVGSNVANILLILGASGVLMAIRVQHSTTWKEVPFSLLAALALLSFAARPYLNGEGLAWIGRAEGFVFLLFFCIFLYYVFEMTRAVKGQEFESLEVHKLSLAKSAGFVVLGLAALYFGGRWTVDGAVFIATLAGISEYVIGLTIVAVGTSLPELFTSVLAAWRGDSDLAVGNVIGSNIFNVFLVLGTTSVIAPVSVPKWGIADLFALIAATLALFLCMFVGRKHELERWQAGSFLVLYAVFVAWLVVRGS